MEHLSGLMTREESDAFVDRIEAHWRDRGFGLWALEVGNSNNNGTPNDLFFTAGPADETEGLFGKIVAPS